MHFVGEITTSDHGGTKGARGKNKKAAKTNKLVEEKKA